MSTTGGGVWEPLRHYVKDLGSNTCFDVVKLLGHIRARDAAGFLASLPDVTSAQLDVTSARQLLQMQAFLKKNASLANDKLCTEAALRGFLDAELSCADTNLRLNEFYANDLYPEAWNSQPKELSRLISKMQSMLKHLLGDVRVFLDSVPSGIRVTSGATESLSRRNARPQLKLRRNLRCVRGSAVLIRTLLGFLGFGEEIKLVEVDHNRVQFVPKNLKTHRVIAAEATATLPFQLAFDTFLKGRLRELWGIDLMHGWKKNASLAALASKTRGYCTVDFSSASDTISLELVALVLPLEWFNLLMRLRSSQYMLPDGSIGTYEKFSSMGNGITFTLETAIFAAAAIAVGARDPVVYGDDVVLPDHLFEPYSALCEFLGFKVNVDKSFHGDVPFRESCGVNAYDGEDITPFYWRGDPASKREMCHLVNGLLSVAVPEGSLFRYLLAWIDNAKLPIVPFNADTGSGIFVTPRDAYRARLIREYVSIDGRHDGVPAFKGLVEVRVTGASHCSWKSYMLWFIRKLIGPPVRTSEYDKDMIRVRSQLLPWHFAGVTPAYLYWVSDALVGINIARRLRKRRPHR